MEDRYWLRHSSLAGHVGPFTRGQLHDAITGGSLPRGGEILRDEGQGHEKRDASTAWSPVTRLLGLPPEPETVAASAAQPISPQRELLQRCRAESAYRPLRVLIEAGTWLAVFRQLVVLIPWPSDWHRLRFEVVCEFVLSVVALLVLRGLLQMAVDCADRGLRRELHDTLEHREAKGKP